MLAYTYIEHGKFELREKPEPKITDARDAIVRRFFKCCSCQCGCVLAAWKTDTQR